MTVHGVTIRRAVPAGLLDAGCASLASFATSLYAARLLSAEDLGTFSLFFTAFLMAAVVPTQLLYAPAEIASLSYEGRRRLRLLDQSMRLGCLPAVAAGLVAVLAAIKGSTDATSEVTSLACTSLACAIVSPMQDHLRRLLHFAGLSWRAAAMSGLHLAVTLGGLFVGTSVGLPAAWVPLGALALGNVLSLLLGIRLASGRRDFAGLEPLALLDLFRFGRWLTLVGLTPILARFASGVLVTHLASAATLGYVEAARVVSQPLFVLMLGLSFPLAPQMMEAAATRSTDLARLASRPFKTIIVVSGLLYLLVVGLQWRFNPVSYLVPKAYVVIGVVPLLIVVQILQGLLHPSRTELTGARQPRTLLRLELVTSSMLCLASAGAGTLGAFAVPLGGLVQSLAGLWLFERARRRIYLDRRPGVGMR
jgi:O-antigen/teichoic acid export membrane protein